MQHCTKYKILDTFHDCIYEERGTEREFIYSDNPCFGDTPFERLSNFFAWCKTHHADMQNIIPVEFEGVE